MAVYDKDADPTTAVNAFLAQFTCGPNGDIRYDAGSDTFHTWWLHRALQKIAWDFTISGDDGINLSKPNPSTSEALGTIITLEDHTTDYSVRYNITDAEAEYFFGGSIEQKSSGGNTDRYAGLIVLGSVNSSSTELQIIQNNALLTSHWGTGKNQTDTSTLMRIVVKTINDGTTTDGGRIIVKANEWGDTFAVWRTTLGLGEAVAAINTFADPQNDTLKATVDAYIGISNTEGYQLIDVGTGGPKPYLSKWDYGGNDKKALYEWVKSQMTRGTSDTIYGIDGDLFTGGPTFSVTLNAGAGGEDWVQNEVVTWTESGTPSSGILMGVDDVDDDEATEMWIHILTGINPTSGTAISGAAASQTVNTITSLAQSPNLLGQFTGAAWIGAFGIGFDENQVTQADAFSPLDGSGPIQPPNNVSVAVTVNGTTNAHVMLARATGGAINQTQYTAESGNNSGDSDLVIKEAIASDTPITGYVLVFDNGTFHPEEYSSWSGSTFTLTGTLSQTYSEDAVVIVPILYHNVAADGGTVNTSLVQSSNIEVAGWVRHGEPGTPHKPVPISGTIGSAGLSLTVQLDAE